jgi:hypothetical protein
LLPAIRGRNVNFSDLAASDFGPQVLPDGEFSTHLGGLFLLLFLLTKLAIDELVSNAGQVWPRPSSWSWPER